MKLKQVLKPMIWLLLCAFMLTSCAVITERKVENEYDMTVEQTDQVQSHEGRVLRAALYFMQKGTNKLVAELRTIVVEADESPVKSIINQLIYGPIDDTLEPVVSKYLLVEKVEVSADVANVYFITQQNLTSTEKFILKLALANTLTDYLSIKYVNVFFNGVSDGFEDYPHPLQKKSSGLWTDAYDEVLSKHIASAKDEADDSMSLGIAIEVPLYFFDASGEYLLPETRNIVFSEEKYLETILQELARGPRNSYVYKPSVAQNLALSQETPPQWEYVDNSNTLSIDLNTSPALSGFEKPKDEYKSYAALIYTLTSFFPNLKTVKISISGEPVLHIDYGVEALDGITRESVSGNLADGVDLYFRIRDAKLLFKVNRMVSQDQVWSANVRLYELMKGPKVSEGEAAWPVFPAGITAQDILHTSIYKSTLVVNLSDNFKIKCQKLSADEEMLLVFAMVNTLTGMQGINSVQFLVEGKKTERLAGHLYFSDIFISNTGIVQIDF